jgi:hypothetical protein
MNTEDVDGPGGDAAVYSNGRPEDGLRVKREVSQMWMERPDG